MKKTLIKLADLTRASLPNYYDYAYAVNEAKKVLQERIGKELILYQTDEVLDNFDNLIEQMLIEKSPDIEIVAAIFEEESHMNVFHSEERGYTIGTKEANNIILFKKHEVALVTINIFQSHADYPHVFVFAPNDAAVLAFIADMTEKERAYMLDGITLLTDTDEGLERTKEEITEQIQREDVLLEAAMKRDIFRSIDEFFNDEGAFYKTYNIPYKRGILLYGSPGNGKTTLVKSIAGSTNAPVVYWQITEFTSSYSISEVFQNVKKIAPVILIIEDIDSMPYEARSVFLNALDGATSKEGIFLIGTTNYPEKIDPALINRAGRFDRAYEIKHPDDETRRYYLSKKNVMQFLDEAAFERLIKETKGLSIAQLNEIYMSIALEWHYEKQVDVANIIAELLENQRKTQKQDWESDDFDDRLGF